jgi:hypothetical protein
VAAKLHSSVNLAVAAKTAIQFYTLSQIIHQFHGGSQIINQFASGNQIHLTMTCLAHSTPTTTAMGMYDTPLESPDRALSNGVSFVPMRSVVKMQLAPPGSLS